MADYQFEKDNCELFIKNAIKTIDNNLGLFPETDCFVPNTSEHGPRIVKSHSKNWWQIPRELLGEIFFGNEGIKATVIIESISPFNSCLGKTLYIQSTRICGFGFCDFKIDGCCLLNPSKIKTLESKIV